MQSYDEIALEACPCCAGAAAFKQYQEEFKLFAVHIACLECGLRTHACYSENEPPAKDWYQYSALAMAWNRRMRPKVAVRLAEPSAWQKFDGEGGHDYYSYSDNEQLKADFTAKNPQPVYKDWVESLYTANDIREQLEAQLKGVVELEVVDYSDVPAGSEDAAALDPRALALAQLRAVETDLVKVRALVRAAAAQGFSKK